MSSLDPNADGDGSLFLDRLEALFLERGLRAVSVAELARELGCSRRRLYEHAPGKEELFLLSAGRFFRAIRIAGDRAARGHEDYDERIRAYLEPGIRGAERLGNAFQEDIAWLPEGRLLYDEHQRLRIGGLRRIIQQGIDEGAFSGVHAHLAAEMMLLAVARIREPAFQQAAGMSFAEGLAELSELLRHGLLPRA